MSEGSISSTAKQGIAGGVFFSEMDLAELGMGDAKVGRKALLRYAKELKGGEPPSAVDVPPSDVRMASPSDRGRLRELMVMLHGENGLFSISSGKVDQMLDRFYNRDHTLIGVVGDIGDPVAAIYLEITQPVYSDDWMLCEQFNFVHPEHRRTSYARQLISYAKKAADQLSLPLMVGILSNKRTEVKMRLYDQVLPRAGGYYVYGLGHADGAQRWGE
jgi:hypothetical protein